MKSDLMLLAEFGEQLAPTDQHPPAQVTERVMTAMRDDRPGRLRLPRTASWPAGARLAWRLGAPAGVAAAIAAGLIAGNVANVAGNAPSPPSGGSTGTGGVATATGTPHAVDGAAAVLRLAAQHAQDTPLLAARDNQFLYVESVEVRSEARGKDLDHVRTVGPLRVRTWLSVDGTRDGLVSERPGGWTRLSGCRNGRQAETIDRPDTSPLVPCTPEPAYRPTAVPTDPDELLAYVYDPKNTDSGYVLIRTPGRPPADWPAVKLSRHQVAFETLIGLLYDNHSPAVQAAVFRTAARIPGVERRSGVSDAAGRTGVAVARTEAGAREELVFDPDTYRFIGHNQIAAEVDVTDATVENLRPGDDVESIRMVISRHARPGDVIQKWAVLRIGVVDRAGQRP